MAEQTSIAEQIPRQARFKPQDLLPGLLLFVATVTAYLPALQGQFVWDDDSWTTNVVPLLRDLGGLRRMWTSPGSLQQYYPLAGTTFWLDYHLWGFWTLPYHVENVLLHALNAVLFWRLLKRLELPGAWLAAALFAVHPVMVESVAWITERKNVLSLALYLGSLLAYTRFTHAWRTDENDETPSSLWPIWTVALVLFLAALLAKATAFSLPAVVLVLCWWKRGRIRLKQDVLPILPFFAVAIASSVITKWLESGRVGAHGAEWALSFSQRCLVAGRALWFYAAKIFWPRDLCFVYPRWEVDTHSLAQWLFPISAAGILLLAWSLRNRIGRGSAASLLLFVGTLFPVLGFMNAYGMRYSFVWNHWVYLSSLSLIALLTAAMAGLAERLRMRFLLPGFAALVLPVLGLLTWREAGTYKDIDTLWNSTLSRNPRAFLAYDNLGMLLLQRGNTDAAISCFEKAVQIQPLFAEAHTALGHALLSEGKVSEAIIHMRKALELRPELSEAHSSLGQALLQNGQIEEGVFMYREAVRIRPDFAVTHLNLGAVLLDHGNLDEAIGEFQRALQINPRFPQAHYNLGSALLRKGKTDEAIAQLRRAAELAPNLSGIDFALANLLLRTGRLDEAILHYRKALEFRPNDVAAHTYLGHALFKKGQTSEALEHYQAAVTLEPDNASALGNLAWALATGSDATLRNGARAVELAEQARKLSNSDPRILQTLAAAYAEKGAFSEAVQTAQQALDLANRQQNSGLADAVRAQITLYRARTPFRETVQ